MCNLKFLALAILAFSKIALGRNIERELTLDPEGRYHLEWEVDFTTKTIIFTATVNTTGYIGLGISPTPSMAGADIVIGGVAGFNPYFADYHALQNGEPQRDAKQDWTLLSVNEQLGVTRLQFSRLLATCDDDDVEITEDTQYLIWAIGQTDQIQYHGPTYRGAVTINLLDPAPAFVDLSEFQVWNVTHEFAMPSADTTYWCSIHKMPEDFNGTQTHIVAFDVILNSEADKQHVHHVVLHRCTPPAGIPSEEFFEEYINNYGDQCYAEAPAVPTLNCLPFVYVWAVGGGSLILPENVGYAMGETGNTEYVMMEVHYNNPEELSGVITTAGVSIYYTTEKRPTNAAVMVVASFPSHPLTIPPKTEEFITVGHCGSDCTNTALPEDGVNLFNVLLHSHLAGRKMKLRHFRDEVELPWLAKDDHYDFNYQASRPLRESVKLMPGDHLSIECSYETLDRNGVTLGGLPSYDEMCETFIWMYPYEEFFECQSLIDPMEPLLNMFGIEELDFDFTLDENPRVVRPLSLFNRTYSSVLNEDPWTEERKAEVQELSRFGPHQQICRIHSSSRDKIIRKSSITYPEIDEEYAPEETCPEVLN